MPPTRNGNWAFSETAAKPTTFSHTLNPGSNRVVLIFVSFKDNITWASRSSPLESTDSSAFATYNGDYSQAGQFRVRYDHGGDNIDAELVVSVDVRDTSNRQTGFVGVFAVWEADLPATTGAKTIQIDSALTSDIMSHVGVIQYDNVLQNAWYSDWTQTQSSSTSHTLNFSTKIADCLLVNFIQTYATNNLIITDNSSQTLENAFTFDAADRAKSAIYSKILPGTGDDSVSYTLGSSTTASIAGIILIPDTETISSAGVIRLLGFNRQQQITTSSSDPTISTTLDSGNDRMVIAVLYWDDLSSHTISTATFGGQSMTHLGQAGNTIGDTYVSAWYLLEEDLPPDGIQSLVINNPTTLDNWIAGIVILENVSQEVPHDFTALTDRSRSLTLPTITPTTEHCWLFQLWGASSHSVISTDVGGMDIWNVRADTVERSRFIAGSLSHDRSVTPTVRSNANRFFSGLEFWVRPSIVDIEGSEHLHTSEEVRPIIAAGDSEHAHTSGPLFADEGIRISVDKSSSVKAFYGIGDGKKENILKSSFSGVKVLPEDQLVKKVRANFRFDYRLDDFIHKDLVRDANSVGREITIPLKFVYSAQTADRILDYIRKDEIAKEKQFSFDGKEEADLDSNDRVNVRIPHLELDSDWQIETIDSGVSKFGLDVKRYIADKYSYEANPSLPEDEELPIVTDFSSTPASLISNLVVTPGSETNPQNETVGYLDLSITPPNDGNYTLTRFFIKRSTEDESKYQKVGEAFDSMRAYGVQLGLEYDVLAVPFNGFKENIGLIETNVLVIGDTTAPAIPPAPTLTVNFRKFTAILPLGTGAGEYDAPDDIDHYAWQIATSSGSILRRLEPKGNQITFDEDYGTVRRVRVRAVDKSGNESNFSPWSINATASLIVEEDVGHNAVTHEDSVYSEAGIQASSGTILQSNTIIASGDNPIRISFKFDAQNIDFTINASGREALLVRNPPPPHINADGTILMSTSTVGVFLEPRQGRSYSNTFVDNFPGVNPTYAIKFRWNFGPSELIRYSNRGIDLIELKDN